MKQNYFEKLEKYIKRVYGIESEFKKLTDDRRNPKYQTDQVISLALFGFFLRVRSFNDLKALLKTGELKVLYPSKTELPGIDTVRSALKGLRLSPLRAVNNSVI